MFQRLITKPSFWEFVINIALTAFIMFALSSIWWAFVYLAAAYALPVIANHYFSNGVGDHPLDRVTVFAGLLVLTIILDLSLSTGKEGMKAGATVSEAVMQMCEQEIPVDGYEEFNANARKCQELQALKRDMMQKGADSTERFLSVFGKNMPSWKVTLCSLLLSMLLTFLTQLFFEYRGNKRQ